MMEDTFFPGNICRLCGEENSEGSSIFQETQFQVNVITLINKYLPIRVLENDKLPKFICQACSLQLYSTIFFLEVVVSGQGKLKDIFQLQKSTHSLDVLPLSSNTPTEVPLIDCPLPKLEPIAHRPHNANVSDPLISSSVSSQLDAQREQYKAMSTLMSPSQVLMHEVPHSAHSENNSLFSEFGDDFKKIFSLPLDETPLYSESHELCTKTIALNEVAPQPQAPKKKRGRPRKDASKPPAEVATNQDKDKDQNSEPPIAKRTRKVPQRYADSIQHADLEKILDGDVEANSKLPLETEPSIPPPDSLMLDDLVPFSIAASDSILDAITSDLPQSSLEGKIASEPKDVPDTDFIISNTAPSTTAPKTPASPNTKDGVIKPRRRKKRKMYLLCEVCNKSFRQHLKLKMHMHTHNPLYKCAQCPMYYHIYSNLEAHHNSEMHQNYEIVDQNVQDPLPTQDSHILDSFILEENSKLTCRHCDKEFLSRSGLMIHVKLYLNKARAYVCPVCKEAFSLHAQLRQHMTREHKSANKKQCVCNICNKQFTHPSSVLYHKETAHSIKTYQCQKCDKQFRHTQLLQRHQLVHMETRPFRCPQCDMCFKTALSLNAHSMKHSAKAYVCEICNKTLIHRSSLISHYRWHQGIKPHKCPQCPKAFNQKGNLKEHFRIHTGEKPFNCDICSRNFTTYSQHKLHLKRHFGEKPHQCELCNKSFLSAESYKCHLRRHRGERPFFCTFENCHQSFVESWALKKHQRVHLQEGEKVSYQCTRCGKSYACLTSLLVHTKTHPEEQQSQSENNAALLNIDLSLLDMSSVNKEPTHVPTEEENLEKLPRTETVATFAETDGNIFYLYEDTNELIPMINEKSATVTVNTQENHHQPDMQNSAFELVSDGAKFQFMRLPIDLTTNAEDECTPPSGPEIIDLDPEAGLELRVVEGESREGEEGEFETAAGGEEAEEGEENFIEFITEDGSLVRMMGVSALQLLSMDPDLQLQAQGTVVE